MRDMYIVSDSDRTNIFGTCYEFKYAHMLASSVSTALTSEAIGTKKPEPKIFVLIFEFTRGTWGYRKIAAYQNGNMIECDRRMKEFNDGQI